MYMNMMYMNMMYMMYMMYMYLGGPKRPPRPGPKTSQTPLKYRQFSSFKKKKLVEPFRALGQAWAGRADAKASARGRQSLAPARASSPEEKTRDTHDSHDIHDTRDIHDTHDIQHT